MTVSIKEFDDILDALQKQGMFAIQVKPAQANATMLQAYERSQYLGKELLDFDNVIWDDDIQTIADTCRKLGIKQFTISARLGNLTDVLAEFQKLGVSVQRITEIEIHGPNGGNWRDNAFLMRVENTPTPAQLWSNAVDALYLADEALTNAILNNEKAEDEAEDSEAEDTENKEIQKLKALQDACSRLIKALESEQ